MYETSGSVFLLSSSLAGYDLLWVYMIFRIVFLIL